MKIAIYTSFAINYLAKARVMVQTVKALNPAIDVVAMVCDRFPLTIDAAKEPFDQIWMVEDYPAEPIRGWIFRHNIMELCTAVKGWGLARLLEAGYDYVMYLDPDCWVLEDPAKIIDLLPPAFSVGVVPHTSRAADSDEEIRIVETSSLRHGIYNLGFLIVRNDDNGRTLANWWAARLDKYCVDDFKAGLFTDQRWFDLALGYYDFITVIRHKGIDVASWNVGQRVLTRNGNGYRIDGDELIFYHFSGVGPNDVHRWVREKFAPADPLVSELEFRYEAMLAAQGQAKLQKVIPYFDLYADGSWVSGAARALYRNRPDLAQRFPDPYAVARAPNFRDAASAEDSAGSAPRTNPGEPAAAVPNPDGVEQGARALFDADFYRLNSGSSATDPDQLWTEYCARAWEPDVSGNRMFDLSFYRMAAGPIDVEAFQTPLHHYAREGRSRGVSPSWIFEEVYYLQRYPDVVDAIRRGDLTCAFEHFSHYGRLEGRSGSVVFNEQAYLSANPDVADAVDRGMIRSGEQHYVQHGHVEGRALG